MYLEENLFNNWVTQCVCINVYMCVYMVCAVSINVEWLKYQLIAGFTVSPSRIVPKKELLYFSCFKTKLNNLKEKIIYKT